MAKATLFFFSSFPIGIKKPFLQSKSPRCPPRKLLKEGGEKERLAARQKIKARACIPVRWRGLFGAVP